MDIASRLKLKVGQHEFEAEGPADVVQAQFQSWKELIANMPAESTPKPQMERMISEAEPASPIFNTNLAESDASLSKIMRDEDRIVSLTVRPKSVEDAVLLIIYGQKILRQNDSVTGGEVMWGLTATGGLAVDRADRLLEKLGSSGDIIVTGERRSKRYRMTNSGLAKARQLAMELLAIVP